MTIQDGGPQKNVANTVESLPPRGGTLSALDDVTHKVLFIFHTFVCVALVNEKGGINCVHYRGCGIIIGH